MIGASSIALGGFSGVAGGHSTQSGVSTINPILTPDTSVHSHGNANEILIRNVGDGSGNVEYRLAVDGKLKAGDEAGDNETIKGNAVEGVVAGQGRDNYFYSGRITTFEITVHANGSATWTVRVVPRPVRHRGVSSDPIRVEPAVCIRNWPVRETSARGSTTGETAGAETKARSGEKERSSVPG